MTLKERSLLIISLIAIIARYWLVNDGGIARKLIFIVLVAIVGSIVIRWNSENRLGSTSNLAVLVTGCDSGFGFLTVQRLAEKGFFVFAGVLNIDSPNAKHLQNVFSEDKGVVLKLDVTSQDDVDNAYKMVDETLNTKNKKLWGLLNNAGIVELGLVESLTIDQYRSVFEVNTIGIIRVSKCFLPLLRWGGRILNITSLASRHSFPVFSAYSASKYATLAFSDALRREMRCFNVKVITIEPTLYKTPMVNGVTSESKLIMNWTNYSDDIKKVYGEQYLKSLADKTRELTNLARTAVHEVIDTIEEAMFSLQPSFHYVPGTVPKIRHFILYLFPESITDRILSGRALPNVKPTFMQTESH